MHVIKKQHVIVNGSSKGMVKAAKNRLFTKLFRIRIVSIFRPASV